MPLVFPARLFWYLAAAAAAGLLLYLTAPILSPFLFSAILAYICLPLVDRLARKLPRWLAVAIVLALLITALCVLLLILVPMVEQQFGSLLRKIPDYLEWARARLLPWLSGTLGIELDLDLAHARRVITDSFGTDKEVVKNLLPRLTSGGAVLIGFFTAVLLVPVVLFYFLRDWHQIVRRLDELIPLRLHPAAVSIAGEIDRVLGEFLRGQISVMLIMSVYYTVALWLAGLEYALPIGILSGLLVFVPYLGALTGLLLGTLAGFNQFDSFSGLIGVWAAFGIGQAVEGTVVTPWLVGDRIGLHPLAVIFALLVFGHLFGFFGVLLALPVSAALLVVLRHLRSTLPRQRPLQGLMKQLALTLAPPPEPSLDNFYPGRNVELVTALRGLADGISAERFFYLWGEPGCGRSHLLRAMAGAFSARNVATVYVGPGSALPPADPALRALAVDDVDKLQPSAQAAFFNPVQLGSREAGHRACRRKPAARRSWPCDRTWSRAWVGGWYTRCMRWQTRKRSQRSSGMPLPGLSTFPMVWPNTCFGTFAATCRRS